jgi:hypothetical protein
LFDAGRRLGALALAALLLLVPATAARSQDAAITLPAGTPVSLRAQHIIATNVDHAAEAVVFVATQPVQVNGVTVIPASSPARGAIIYARGAGLAHGARLMISVDSVQAADGTWLPLRMTPQRQPGVELLPLRDEKRQHRQTLQGRDVVLTPDVTFTAYIDNGRRFSVAPSTVAGMQAIQALAPEPPPVASNQMLLKLADGTPISLHPCRDLNSGHLKTGQRLDFVVAEPLMVNGITIAAPGARAVGTVLFDRHAGLLARPGALAFCVDSVQTVDGKWLDVHASTDRYGGNFTGMTPPVGPFWLPIVPYVLPGTNAKLHKERWVTVFVNGDRFFALDNNHHVTSVPNVSDEEATAPAP